MTSFARVLRNLRIVRRLILAALDPQTRQLPGFPVVRFLLQWRRFVALDPATAMRADFADLWPVLDESDAPAGELTWFFHQDLWAARKIHEARPLRHMDIGSRIDGFVAHVLAFMPVEYVDVRPLPGSVKGLTPLLADATLLEGVPDGSVPSLSSLSAAEHFGLGRYSDPIDPSAAFRFMDSLCRVLAPGGRLYLSVPIGRERVEFNAHRVFAIPTVLERFRTLRLESFSYVDMTDALHEDIDPGSVPAGTESYAGLFEFSKR